MTDSRSHSRSQASLFIAHGSPDLILSDIPARKFLQETGQRLPVPRGIVVVSAHWVTPDLQATGPSALETIHDFYGYPAELYDIKYAASGASWLNEQIIRVLGEAGYPVRIGPRSGLDHGAWIPLMLMYPNADIPVIQLSLKHSALPEQHFQIGQVLDGLRQDGILILGSGGLVHNLRLLKPEGSPTDDWALSFDNWLFERLVSHTPQELFSVKSRAEYAHRAHPTDEHLMPLFVSMGAGWTDGDTQRIHHSFSYGNLSMTSYSFANTD